MHHTVESNKDDQNEHGPWRSIDQLKPKEDGSNTNDLGTVADKPVKPVEDGTPSVSWGAATQGHKRLDETQT